MDPESPEGQVILKVQFIIISWQDIWRKLERIADWQEKGLNELLREAQKVYVRWEEEKAKSKAKIMVAVAKESREEGRKNLTGKEGREELKSWEVQRGPYGGEDYYCYYCGKKGHIKRQCEKWKRNQKVFKESQGETIED